MPIFYVNPARKHRRKKARKSKKGKLNFGQRMARARRRGRKVRANPAKAKRRRARRSKEKKMPKRRRKGSRRARRATSRKRRTTRRKRKGSKRRTKRRARRAPKRRRKARRSGGKRRRTRRKRKTGKRRRARRSSSRGRKGKRRRRKGKRRTSRRRRRRSARTTVLMSHTPGGTRIIHRNPSRRRRRRKGRSARARHHRRHARRYHRNPGGPVVGAVMAAVKRAAPIMVALYGSRFVVNYLLPHIPYADRLGMHAKPLAALGGVGLVHVITKKSKYAAKYRTEALIGAALNFLDTAIKTYAPASIQSMLGDGMGEYVTTGDYLMTDGTPIDDDLALSDYISVGDIEEELGAMGDGLEQELGLEQDLGDSLTGSVPGGLSRTALMAGVPTRSFVAGVPQRSFTKVIPRAGANFDDNSVYAGIFAKGF